MQKRRTYAFNSNKVNLMRSVNSETALVKHLPTVFNI